MRGVGMALREEEEGEGQRVEAEDWPREMLRVYVSASAFVDDCGFLGYAEQGRKTVLKSVFRELSESGVGKRRC